MLNLKKFYSDELLQLALLLSLLRVDPDSYLGLDVQTIGINSLDLNNGSGWHTDSHTIVHRPAFVHPKNLDSILLNYERDLFEDLNALGRYNRFNVAHNDIHAYLLNIDERAGPSTTVTDAADNARNNANSPDPPTPSQTTNEGLGAAELTQEDMDLIEVLWKQDVDLGFTLVDPVNAKNPTTSSKEESEDDIEKLKALEAINGADDKKIKDEEPLKEDDPWARLAYAVDLESGEYTINSGSEESEQQLQEEAQDQEEEQNLLGEAGLGLGSVDELVGLGEDSLGLNDSLGLENDFTSELLGENCLLDSLGNDTLGLPDGFNLEEALQLVGLNEVHSIEKKQEVKEKNAEDNDEAASVERSESRDSTTADKEELGAASSSSREEEDEDDNMIHTPQYHHPHHPHHHRSFQSRVPFARTVSMDPRWPDIAPFFTGAGGEHFVHPNHHHHHHHHHTNYTSLGTAHHGSYEASAAQRNVLLHNATLAPPVGDLNSTGTYHNTGGPSNLGSAVATSMNLTNSSEPMGADTGSAYKSEPNDMMYYSNASADTMNQTSEYFNALLSDEQFSTVWNSEDLNFNISDGLYGGSGGASGATGATATLPGVQGAGANGVTIAGAGGATSAGTGAAGAAGATSLGAVTDERMDASSDSAVSSMGSERVPSLSDGEWMETGSNSSHTQADSHYSMDYAGKYRMPYDCGYTLPAGRGNQRNCQAAAERGGIAPVAQKKHHLFGKQRCFQENSMANAGPPLATATPHHPAVTPMKYDYEAAQTVAAGPPNQAYSGPIEGAAGPQTELKYSCSVDFARHQGRSLEHVHHNHTYHLSPESAGALQRPISRDKKTRKSEADEHLTRDEKRARALNVPIPVSDIINLPMDEFNERLSKYDLSEAQLSLIRDIRRRGKNKVAAQNCRKRKLDQINSLSDEVKEMRNRKMRLISERNYMLQEVARVKEKFGQLYRHIFHALRDPDGHPYNTMEYSLQLSADGNVVLVPRSTQSNGHYTRSIMDSTKKAGPDNNPHNQQHHHQDRKE